MTNQSSAGLFDIEDKHKKYLLFFPLILNITIFFRGLNNDIWFLLTHGRYVINNGIPTVEPFTIHEGFKFVMQQWLSSVIFYVTYSWFGEYGLKLLVICAYIISMVIFYKLCMKLTLNNFFKSIIITYLYITLINVFMTTRPFIFTNIVLLFEVYVLEMYFIEKNEKLLLILPLLSLVLINIQAAMWPMLFIIMSPFVIDSFKFHIGPFRGYGAKKKQLFIAGFSMVIMGFVNPYGFDSMVYIKNSYGVPEINDMVGEMAPATTTTVLGLLIILICVSVTLLYIFGKSEKKSLRYILLAIGTSYISLSTVRGFIFFICCALYPLSVFIDEVRIPRFDGKYPERTILIRKVLVILIIFITPVAFYRLSTFTNKYNSETDLFNNALEYVIKDIKEESVILYTGYNDGGLAEFKGVASYIDPRAEVFLKDNNMVSDVFIEYYDLQKGILYYKEFLAKYNFTHLIVDSNDILFTYLPHDKDYTIIFSNNKYILFKRLSKAIRDS
jgi:hypothetical protein